MRNKIKNIIHTDIPHKCEWIILLGIMAGLSCFYLYFDIVETSAAGINVWHSISEGKLPHFYQYPYPYSLEPILEKQVVGGAYDFLIYIVFAVYDFPAWLWEKATNTSVFSSYFMRVYIKGIIWIFIALISWVIYKLAILCDTDQKKAKWAVILFLTSGFLFYSEILIGGYDVISLSFTLLGVYGYLKNDQKCFIFCFALAVAFKMFALFVFVPLLLLREKRIRYILFRFLQILLFIIIPKLFFSIAAPMSVLGAEADTAEKTLPEINFIAHSSLVKRCLFPGNENVADLAVFTIPGVPLFLLLMFILCLGCYLYEKAVSPRQVIYLCAVTMGLFFMTCMSHPYWIILLIPYISLLMIFSVENLKKNVLLESVMAIGWIGMKSIVSPGCSGLNLISSMVRTDKIRGFLSAEEFSSRNYWGIWMLWKRLGDSLGLELIELVTALGFLFLAAFIVFLVINYPNCPERKSNNCINYVKIRMLCYFRFGFGCLIALLPWVGYYLWTE